MPYAPEALIGDLCLQPNTPWNIAIRGIDMGLERLPSTAQNTYVGPYHRALAHHMEHLARASRDTRKLAEASESHYGTSSLTHAYDQAVECGYIVPPRLITTDKLRYTSGTRIAIITAIGALPFDNWPRTSTKAAGLEVLGKRATSGSAEEAAEQLATIKSTLASRLRLVRARTRTTNTAADIALLAAHQQLSFAKRQTGKSVPAREVDISILASVGLSNRQIADQFIMSVGGITPYLSHFYAAFGIIRRTQLLAICVEEGFVAFGVPRQGDHAVPIMPPAPTAT